MLVTVRLFHQPAWTLDSHKNKGNKTIAVVQINEDVITKGEKLRCCLFVYILYRDEQTTPILMSKFPERSPENLLPVSKMGSRTTINTPTKPINIPTSLFRVILSLNNI